MRYRFALSLAFLVALLVVVTAAIPSSDNFNRANENPIGGNWTNESSDTMQIASNVVWPAAGANLAMAYWNADSYNANQFSQATIGGAALGSNYAGVAVRMAAGALTAYIYGDVVGTYKIQKIVAGTTTDIQTCSGTPTASDVLKLSVSGTSLTGTVNGGSTCNGTDSSIASGQPGIWGYSSLGNSTVDDWSADNVSGGGGGCTGGLLLLGAGKC